MFELPSKETAKVQALHTINSFPRTAVRVALRLRALVDGVEPMNRHYGICNDIIRHADDDEKMVAGMLVEQVLIALTGQFMNPLGDMYQEGDKWVGERGAARLALAKQMSDLIEKLAREGV